MVKKLYIIVGCGILLASCGKKNPVTPPPLDTNKVVVDTNGTGNNPSGSGFNADSAYAYISKQMSFGDRVPNSPGHKACGDYLVSSLKKYADKVTTQEATVNSVTIGSIKIRNIIARFDESNSNRIALFAHWDTRYSADRTDATKTQKVPGADDGGSGVGILLEIARQLKVSKPKIGIDIVLFDAEDQGQGGQGGAPDSWCLGSQYWAKNNPLSGSRPKYGILLDMVGARNATFLKEKLSVKVAPSVVDNVWNVAMNSGYGAYFINAGAEEVTDDHTFINKLAKIPTIDIINYDQNRVGQFGPHWHTPNDNMEIIDKLVLKAVGQTVMNVIYTEQ